MRWPECSFQQYYWIEDFGISRDHFSRHMDWYIQNRLCFDLFLGIAFKILFLRQSSCRWQKERKISDQTKPHCLDQSLVNQIFWFYLSPHRSARRRHKSQTGTYHHEVKHHTGGLVETNGSSLPRDMQRRRHSVWQHSLSIVIIPRFLQWNLILFQRGIYWTSMAFLGNVTMSGRVCFSAPPSFASIADGFISRCWFCHRHRTTRKFKNVSETNVRLWEVTGKRCLIRQVGF